MSASDLRDIVESDGSWLHENEDAVRANLGFLRKEYGDKADSVFLEFARRRDEAVQKDYIEYRTRLTQYLDKSKRRSSDYSGAIAAAAERIRTTEVKRAIQGELEQVMLAKDAYETIRNDFDTFYVNSERATKEFESRPGEVRGALAMVLPQLSDFSKFVEQFKEGTRTAKTMQEVLPEDRKEAGLFVAMKYTDLGRGMNAMGDDRESRPFALAQLGLTPDASWVYGLLDKLAAKDEDIAGLAKSPETRDQLASYLGMYRMYLTTAAYRDRMADDLVRAGEAKSFEEASTKIDQWLADAWGVLRAEQESLPPQIRDAPLLKEGKKAHFRVPPRSTVLEGRGAYGVAPAFWGRMLSSFTRGAIEGTAGLTKWLATAPGPMDEEDFDRAVDNLLAALPPGGRSTEPYLKFLPFRNWEQIAHGFGSFLGMAPAYGAAKAAVGPVLKEISPAITHYLGRWGGRAAEAGLREGTALAGGAFGSMADIGLSERAVGALVGFPIGAALGGAVGGVGAKIAEREALAEAARGALAEATEAAEAAKAATPRLVRGDLTKAERTITKLRGRFREAYGVTPGSGLESAQGGALSLPTPQPRHLERQPTTAEARLSTGKVKFSTGKVKYRLLAAEKEYLDATDLYLRAATEGERRTAAEAVIRAERAHDEALAEAARSLPERAVVQESARAVRRAEILRRRVDRRAKRTFPAIEIEEPIRPSEPTTPEGTLGERLRRVQERREGAARGKRITEYAESIGATPPSEAAVRLGKGLAVPRDVDIAPRKRLGRGGILPEDMTPEELAQFEEEFARQEGREFTERLAAGRTAAAINRASLEGLDRGVGRVRGKALRETEPHLSPSTAESITNTSKKLRLKLSKAGAPPRVIEQVKQVEDATKLLVEPGKKIRRQLKSKGAGGAKQSALTFQENATTAVTPESGDALEQALLPGRAISREGWSVVEPRRIPPKKLGDIPPTQTDVWKKLNEIAETTVRIQRRLKPATALGFYIPTTGSTVIRNRSISTMLHEAAHAFDDVKKFSEQVLANKFPGVIQELDQPAFVTSTPPGATPFYKTSEQVAQWWTAYVTNPEATAQATPLVVKAFKEIVGKKRWKEFDELAQMVGRHAFHAERDPSMQIIRPSQVVLRDRPSWSDRLRGRVYGRPSALRYNWLDWIETRAANALAPAAHQISRKAPRVLGRPLRPSEDPRAYYGRLAGTADATYRGLTEYGLRDAGEIGKPRLDPVSGKPLSIPHVIEPLAELIEGVKLSKEEMALRGARNATDYWYRYGLALLTTERSLLDIMRRGDPRRILMGVGSGMFRESDVFRAFIRDFHALPQEQQAKITEFARRYRALADAEMQNLVEDGYLTRAAYRDIKSKNLHYAMMRRFLAFEPSDRQAFQVDIPEMERTTAQLRKNLTQNAKLIHTATGSDLEIVDPLVMLADWIQAAEIESARNAWVRSVVDLARPTSIRYAGDPGAKRSLADIAEMVSKGEVGRVLRVKTALGEEFWRINDPNIYLAFEAGRRIMGTVPSWVPRYRLRVQSLTTKMFDFMWQNFGRDWQGALLKTRSGVGPGKIIPRRIVGPLPSQATRQKFLLSGGGGFGYYGRGPIKWQGEIDRALRHMRANKNKWILMDPRTTADDLFRWYSEQTSQSEIVPRIGEYERMYQEGLSRNYSQYEAHHFAMAGARDMMDFSLQGSWTGGLGKIVPFLNAGIQGAYATANAFREMPARMLIRSGIATGVVNAMEISMAEMAGRLDDLQNMPIWMRNFMLIPGGGEDSWIAWPLAYEMRFSRHFQYHQQRYEETKDKDEYVKAVVDLFSDFVPLLEVSPTDILTPIGKGIAEIGLNIRTWPEAEELIENRDAAPIYRTGQNRASKAARGLFEMLGGKVGALEVKPFQVGPLRLDIDDPRQVDHLFRILGGQLGAHVTELSQIGKGGYRGQSPATLARFVRKTPPRTPSIEEFFAVVAEHRMQSDRRVRHLKLILDEAQDATNSSAYIAGLREANDYAQDHIAELREEGERKATRRADTLEVVRE